MNSKMPSSTILKHATLGDVCYKTHLRSTKITIKITSKGEIVVTIPSVSAMTRAVDFVDQNCEAIMKQVVKLREKNPLVIYGAHSEVRTFSHTLLFIAQEKCKQGAFSYSIDSEFTRVVYAPNMDWSKDWVQDGIRTVIAETYRREAKEYLPHRVAALAKEFGFQYAALAVRNTKTQWGSCSSLKRLSFSLHIMSLPSHLIDFIILHELCHTAHMNHSAYFHALLLKCEPLKLIYEKELKQRKINAY